MPLDGAVRATATGHRIEPPAAGGCAHKAPKFKGLPWV
jgi:hypothetical protein